MPRSATDRRRTTGTEAEAVGALMRASRVITAAIVHSLSAVDPSLTVTQLRVLVMVGSRGPLTVTAVADALGVNASNASRTCERLVAAGLLDRTPAERDRRQVDLTLTRRGAALVDSVMVRRQAELARVVERMEGGDRATLVAALDAFAAAAAGAAGPAEAGDEHLIAWLS